MAFCDSRREINDIQVKWFFSQSSHNQEDGSIKICIYIFRINSVVINQNGRFGSLLCFSTVGLYFSRVDHEPYRKFTV